MSSTRGRANFGSARVVALDAFIQAPVASRALPAGESVDEIAFLLAHRDANVTRAVYVREVADARRRSMRRTRMVAEFGGALRIALNPGDEAG
jgi:integrase